MVGKCLCLVTKTKSADFLAPHLFGVAYLSSAENVIHKLRVWMATGIQRTSYFSKWI